MSSNEGEPVGLKDGRDKKTCCVARFDPVIVYSTFEPCILFVPSCSCFATKTSAQVQVSP